MGDWFGIVIVFGVAVFAFLLKFVIIKCYLAHCRRGRNNQSTWTDVEEGPSLEAFFIGDANAVRCLGGRNKGPPPKFEKALKCSSPVHFIEVNEEEPPPSYEEYMKGQTKLFTITTLSSSSSSSMVVEKDETSQVNESSTVKSITPSQSLSQKVHFIQNVTRNPNSLNSSTTSTTHHLEPIPSKENDS